MSTPAASDARSVVVVGAGITGLTAAYELARLGARPIVLEASSRSGGLIKTEHTGGFTIEAGPDAILASKPAGVALLAELGLESSQQSVLPPGGAFVLRGRKLHRIPYPSRLGLPLAWSALARYTLLPWHARVRLALEPRVPPRTDTGDESIASFFRRRFGPDTVGLIAQPLLGGIHAGDVERLSMDALLPALRRDERANGHILNFGASPGAEQPSASPFLSLRGGMSALPAALERALPAGTIRYHAPVESIVRTTSGWRIAMTATTDRAPIAIEASAVILAVPAHVAARLLSSLDAEAARLAGEVPYASTASVAIAWPRAAIAHPLNGTGFVVARQRSRVRITACTWVSSKWEGRAPKDTALLRAFLGGSHDPAAVTLSDDELVAVVRRDLTSILNISGDPLLARAYRWPAAAAQHLVGHAQRMDALDARLAGLPGMFVAGSGFRAIGIPDCIADARRVAARAVTS